MRIGIDGRLWNETGVGRYIRNLARYLEEIDKENEYVLFVKDSDVSSIKYQVLSIKNAKNWKIVSVNIRWHSVDEQLRLPAILEKEKLDLAHFPYFSVPIFYKGKFVVTIHDLIIHHFDTGRASTLPIPFYKAKRLGYKLIMRQVAKRAAKIIAVSNTTKDEVIKHLKVDLEKVVVMYEGVDPNVSSIKYQVSSIKEPYFLYVGNAYPHKNLERLVDAFNALIHTTKYVIHNTKLVLVGKEDYFYTRLKEKVKGMGLENSVVFHIPESDEELAYLYQHAKALIMPSLMEGFGLPPLEAMANNCLVLASDIPAVREVCGEVAIYFNPYDVVDLTAKLREAVLQSNSLGYRTKKASGFERAKMFSWKKMAEETLRVYEEAV